ncbi:MAG: hypothetical protein HOV80_20130 [Polyangiaceae bacterium]|nr:hypothetical protein [Polyangiaceae bacterium]
MELTSVTLDEVFAAAQARAASLVPETSGYLALAVADASARLPYLLEDPMVMLTSEGTVKVSRGTQVVPPEESATRIRELLARLLDCSAGSMPALAATAKPRSESADDVETFIRELEAALVPVNRAAARRALARLARETVRAKDSGRLRRRKRRAQPSSAPAAPEAPRAAAPIAAPAVAAPPIAPHAVAAPPIEEAVEVEFTPHAPPPIEVEPVVEPTPIPEEPPTMIDAEVAPVAAVAAAPAAEAPAPAPVKVSSKNAVASLGSTAKSDVDDLLERFVVSTLSSPESMREARASLKRLAGLDPTPPPPAAAEIRRLTAALESVARAKREVPAPELPPALPKRSGFRAGMVAIALIALVAAGLLGHYLPRLLAAATPPDHALTSAPSR